MIAVQKKEKPIIQFDSATLWFSLYPYYISIIQTKPFFRQRSLLIVAGTGIWVIPKQNLSP